MLLGGLAVDPTHRDLLADLQPSGLKSGREVSDDICQALRSGLQDSQDFTTRSEVFRSLEQAQPQRVEKASSRLDLTGLIAPEVDTCLQEVQALREALGEPVGPLLDSRARASMLPAPISGRRG